MVTQDYFVCFFKEINLLISRACFLELFFFIYILGSHLPLSSKCVALLYIIFACTLLYINVIFFQHGTISKCVENYKEE
ncbi:hypothetical protein HanRHA438_Chr08g0361361 [Helianthus annuus]|nr:hypothetical protein HanHA89_Chr08g0306421 [Helianthus annuus]KAJ0613270.1 hypothetical protein HanHA300_Chr01g0036241 [Helianthus annuus]KAJ0719916.1 hypothetical protein HanLR1_Chr08g0287131 [Helianthus annuus]KAJ0723145.1 hypothetical protein HanOQP8_Chr08g0294661 [Helianthus annuus]KAJ0898838.1 hypothetical protein HanRHA438_Chr08g0361361 [Helianthus annuus]